MYHDNLSDFNREAEERKKRSHFDDTAEMLSFSAEQTAGSLLRMAIAFERIADALEKIAAKNK